MWYLLAQTVLMSTSVPVSFEFQETWPPLLSTAAQWLAFGVVNAAGILVCYEANRQGDNREFVNRFVCLSWPITIRLLTLFILPVGAALFAAAWWASWQGTDGNLQAELVAQGLGLALSILYYWRVRTHLGWIAAESSP
jgi:hypothetical protein